MNCLVLRALEIFIVYLLPASLSLPPTYALAKSHSEIPPWAVSFQQLLPVPSNGTYFDLALVIIKPGNFKVY